MDGREGIVDYNSKHICKEKPYMISDEKLKAMLRRAYERAQRDMSAAGFYKNYSIFISIAGTLLLSLLTSEFGAVGKVGAETVTSIAWFICIGCGILGFVLMGIAVSKKVKYDMEKRDAAVEDIIKQVNPDKDK